MCAFVPLSLPKNTHACVFAAAEVFIIVHAWVGDCVCLSLNRSLDIISCLSILCKWSLKTSIKTSSIPVAFVLSATLKFLTWFLYREPLTLRKECRGLGFTSLVFLTFLSVLRAVGPGKSPFNSPFSYPIPLLPFLGYAKISPATSKGKGGWVGRWETQPIIGLGKIYKLMKYWLRYYC